MADLSAVKSIVYVMMENRSFDHMLGYLSLPPFNRNDVIGLSSDPAWVTKYSNGDQGRSVAPFLSVDPYKMPTNFDPPHERPYVEMHLGAPVSGDFPMNGFLDAIPTSVSTDPNVRKLAMSYFGASQVPMTHFLASHFLICDNWFCSLPAGTQPNRLMAMSGSSRIDLNRSPLEKQRLVYDWLNDHGISWRVYHQGLPFFSMMLDWLPKVLQHENFRSFSHFEEDLVNTPPKHLPKVIFVEPTYGDAPHVGPSTDDHAPAGVSHGQGFLSQVYSAVTASPTFWRGSVMLITYDEHGGLFDHVTPPLITTQPPSPGLYPSFTSLGVRVPTYVISPFVRPGSVCHDLFDHTSFLKFLGEKFGHNGKYEEPVDARDVKSISLALDFQHPHCDPVASPNLQKYLAGNSGIVSHQTLAQQTPLQQAFVDAIYGMKKLGATPGHEKFGREVNLV